MKRVVAAVYPRALATSLALPMDVLQAAGQAASRVGFVRIYVLGIVLTAASMATAFGPSSPVETASHVPGENV